MITGRVVVFVRQLIIYSVLEFTLDRTEKPKRMLAAFGVGLLLINHGDDITSVGQHHGRSLVLGLGGNPRLPFTSFLPLYPIPSPFLCPLPSYSPSFLPFPLAVGPIYPARGSGERCKLPQWGLGRSSSRNRIWCILALKYDIWWQQF